MTPSRFPLLWLLLAVVAIRAGLFLFGWLSFQPQTGQPANWLSIWDHWDAKAYTIIAAQGYFPEGVPELQKAVVQRFPPLYPLLVRLVAESLHLSLQLSGIALSGVCALAGSALLYRLCLDEGLKTRQAVAAVLLFSLYPTSFVTHSIYAESLFVLWVIGSFVAMRRDWFWLAGLAAAGAVLTRVVGIALLPALAVALVQRWRAGRLRWFDLAGLAFPAVALLGYLLMNAWLFGAPTHFLTAYQAGPAPLGLQWPLQETFALAGGLLQRAWAGTLTQAYMMAAGWSPLFTGFCLGTLLLWLRCRPRWDLVTFAIAYLLLVTSFKGNVSLPRYTFAVIPMFLAIGQMAHPVVQVCLGGVFGWLLLLFVGVFVNGGWAF